MVTIQTQVTRNTVFKPGSDDNEEHQGHAYDFTYTLNNVYVIQIILLSY